MLQIERTYDPPARGDGRRILVERLWPRGLEKEAVAADAWLGTWPQHGAMAVVWPSRGASGGRSPALAEGAGREPRYLGPILDAKERGAVTLLYSVHDVLHSGAVALRYLVERQARRPRLGKRGLEDERRTDGGARRRAR